MKILALHGSGTSSDIFKLQTARFREQLPSSWEFDWLDGDVPAPAAPGLDQTLFPGPYLAYFPRASAQHIASAIELVEECIELDGPYDGAMGFSQGASLLASVLLHRKLTQPTKPSPFRFVIFLHGIIPWSPDPTFNQPLYEFMQARARELVDDDADVDKNPDADVVNPRAVPNMKAHDFNSLPIFPDEALKVIREKLRQDNPHIAFPSRDVSSSGEDQAQIPSNAQRMDLAAISRSKTWGTPDMPRFFHPDLNPTLQISVPTAHITGSEDHWKQSAYCLRRLCDPKQARSFEHSAAHEIPWDPRSSQSIVKVIEAVVAMANTVT